MQCDEAYLNSALDAAATRTYRMAARFGLPTADREDIQQELMLDMLERADQFDPAKCAHTRRTLLSTHIPCRPRSH